MGTAIGSVTSAAPRGSSSRWPSRSADGLAEQAELSGAVTRLNARTTVELAEQVAHVHVDRARADEELLGDLAVGAADRDVAQHLELAPGQLALIRRGRRPAAEPLRHRLAHLG